MQHWTLTSGMDGFTVVLRRSPSFWWWLEWVTLLPLYLCCNRLTSWLPLGHLTHRLASWGANQHGKREATIYRYDIGADEAINYVNGDSGLEFWATHTSFEYEDAVEAGDTQLADDLLTLLHDNDFTSQGERININVKD